MMQNATQIASELWRGKGMVIVFVTGSPDQIPPPRFRAASREPKENELGAASRHCGFLRTEGHLNRKPVKPPRKGGNPVCHSLELTRGTSNIFSVTPSRHSEIVRVLARLFPLSGSRMRSTARRRLLWKVERSSSRFL